MLQPLFAPSKVWEVDKDTFIFFTSDMNQPSLPVLLASKYWDFLGTQKSEGHCYDACSWAEEGDLPPSLPLLVQGGGGRGKGLALRNQPGWNFSPPLEPRHINQCLCE